MININNLNLLDIAATSTLDDITTRHIYESIDYVLQKENEKLKDIFNVVERLNFLTETEIEFLLWEYHVDVINDNLTLQEKRILVAESLLTHMKKGTRGSVETLCNILFGESIIQSWYEYGGVPGKFKIKTEANTSNPVIYNNMINVINQTKNVRSHLESIEYIRKNNVNYFVGTGINNFIKQIIKVGE